MADTKRETDRPMPDVVGILPLRGTVLFPQAVVPLGAGRASSLRLIEEAVQGGRLVGAVTQKDPKEDAPRADGLYSVGTLTVIHKAIKQPDGTLRLVAQGVGRFRLLEILQTEPYLKARIETINVRERLAKLATALGKEAEVLELGSKIQSEIQSEMSKTQRDYYLREQMKAIQKELGEGDERTQEVDALRAKIEAAGMPTEAKAEALRELDRLAKMPPAAAEYTVARTYIDWLVAMPWQQETTDAVEIAPARAILDVLDPEQNATFRDHYLDVPFDLSRVLFITTANVMDTVPPPLRDRMEIIHLAGYTEEEKIAIARRHLVPKQAREHGLADTDIEFTPEALRLLARGYTREAGVRNLEREIASVCRKVARGRAEGRTEPARITPDAVTSFLGAPRFEFEELAERTRVPGVATGMAWTPAGGDVLFVEATRMPGKGTLTLTGQLGDVMKESAHAALSWVRSHARELQIDPGFWERSDIHVHVPAGAIPKDGPSAGVTMATALVSLLTGCAVR